MNVPALTIQRLIQAVEEDAAIRRIRRLQPTGGPGDKVFPPTFPGARDVDPPRHVFERRRVNGADVLCVLVDSVQSQANRLEEALRALREAGKIWFPTIAVDFAGTDVADIGTITALDAPHRVYDAILRDSQLGDTAFRDTTEGKELALAKTQNASSLFRIAPTALVFGAWNSTGDGGGLGAKFPRAVVSEIVGVNVATEPAPTKDDPERVVASGQRPGSRIDPLGIRSGVRVWKAPDGSWSFDAPKQQGAETAEDGPPEVAEARPKGKAKAAAKRKASKKAKRKEPTEVRPSEVNHSNIAPTLQPLGVSVDHLVHTFVVSLAALRRLHFPADPAKAADTHARAALAAIAITSGLAQDRAGYFLRSRCDLVPLPDEPSRFCIVRSDGSEEAFSLTVEGAAALVKEAAAAASAAGVTWRDEDVKLKPQPKLLELVKRSRAQALQGIAEAEARG